MLAKSFRFAPVFIVIIVLAAVILPSPAIADGGPIVPHDLWADLEEGHQIGVVTILDENSAKIDLFISILDTTSISHEITFFVPIGTRTSDFAAVEEDLFKFDNSTTADLDQALRDGADNRNHAVQALFSGALLTNGALLIPAWAPVLLTGCGAGAAKPETVLTTASSQISIYGIDDNTDINALIATTGLPQSVADTLATLKGQQVAIIKLNTKPSTVITGKTNQNPGQAAPTEPGLHLSWKTAYVMSGTDKTFVYPLGTGAAWSKPIRLTRVYIQALPGLDFNVNYPALGTQHSGFDIIEGSKIQHFFDIPAYAVDEARGDYGRVWRATYTQSNPTKDVVITVKTASGFSKFRAGLEQDAFGYSIIFAFVIGILVWVLAWRFLMPVFTGGKAVKKPGWFESLIYPGINLVFIIFPGSVVYLIFILGGTAPALVIQFLIGAGISIGIFMLIHSKRLGVTRGKALTAFILTSLCGSAAYLLLAVGFGFLVNAI